MTGVSRVRRLWVVLACAFAFASGCTSATPLVVPFAGPEISCLVPAPEGDLLLGVALSGGGSRAAVFGAASLEALGRIRHPGGGSVLERIDYVSSVSGGSVAASYYATRKPGREVPVLTAEGDYTPEYRAFFDQYNERIAQNFEGALIRRQLASFRWLNSALGARSLSEVLTERLLGEVRLEAVSDRQRRRDIPGLLFNASLFNSGQRFVMTTLPRDVARYDVFADLRQAAEKRGESVEFVPLSQRVWEGLMPLTPLDLRFSPCEMPLAGVVAASASFPPLVGPITFRVEGEETYWHAGDGGLYENTGVETLLFVLLKKVQEKKARRALIFAFDSSYPFSVSERVLARRSEPFSLFTYDFSRIPGIMEQRAYGYNHLFFRTLRTQGVIPGPDTVRIMFLNHTDAKWRGDLADLPAACRNEQPPLRTPTEVTERLAEIPTRFKMISECNRQLLVTAAAKVVSQSRPEIEDFLAGRPTPERTAQ